MIWPHNITVCIIDGAMWVLARRVDFSSTVKIALFHQNLKFAEC